MIEHEHPVFGFERSNFETNRAFTRFAKLLFELTQTSLFQTSNELECAHILVIELEHPIFGFERSNIVRPIISIYLPTPRASIFKFTVEDAIIFFV